MKKSIKNNSKKTNATQEARGYGMNERSGRSLDDSPNKEVTPRRSRSSRHPARHH